MNISKRLAVLERIFDIGDKNSGFSSPPPDQVDFVMPDGSPDRHGYYAACNVWCEDETGKTIHQIAKEIAEDEDF